MANPELGVSLGWSSYHIVVLFSSSFSQADFGQETRKLGFGGVVLRTFWPGFEPGLFSPSVVFSPKEKLDRRFRKAVFRKQEAFMKVRFYSG